MEQASNRKRVGLCFLLWIILTLVYIKPKGLIDFRKYESKTLLEAKAMGGGNCNTRLRLLENGKFVENNICFGTSQTKGYWSVKNDTIYFTQVKLGRSMDSYYDKAYLVKPAYEGAKEVMLRYHDGKVNRSRRLLVLKNEL